jgi:RimJ/RimL family protein N-acetyltransferase
MAYGPFLEEQAFALWLAEKEKSRDPWFYALVPRGAEAAGMASFLRADPANGVIEIGNIWLAPALQKTRAATEAIFLLMRHAFEELGVRRLEWKCDALNAPSRRAADRFGFTFEGVFRQHMVIKGRNRDTAWYAITDAEWPEIRHAFEGWLAPENFSSDGTEKAKLRVPGAGAKAAPGTESRGKTHVG